MKDVDRLFDELEGYHLAISPGAFGGLELIMSLPAETLRQAVTSALALVTVVDPPLQIRTVSAMTTEEFDRRLGIEPFSDIVGVSEAAGLLGCTRQRVLQLVEAGQLPSQRAGKAIVIPRSAVLKRAEDHPRRPRPRRPD